MTTTILITASILIGFLLIMHYANLFLPKDPVKPGKEAHIYLDGRYNSHYQPYRRGLHLLVW
jgi:hypothetical protein